MEEEYMKNKKMLAMLLALTVTAAGTPVYAADFSDGCKTSGKEHSSKCYDEWLYF